MTRVTFSACFLAIAMVAGQTLAAPPTDKAAAQALFDEGKRLMSQGHYAEGCPKLAESQRLDPAPGTLMNLADCYEKSGLTASAWATWLEAAAATKQAGQQEREQLARKRADALKPRLVHIEVTVPSAHRVPGLEVRKDDILMRDATWGIAVPIDPGTHIISAKAPGYRSWNTRIIIVDGAKPPKVVVPHLDLETTAVAPVGATKPAQSAPEPPGPASSPAGTNGPAALPNAQPQTTGPSPAQPYAPADSSMAQPAASADQQAASRIALNVPAEDKPTTEEGPAIRTVSFVARLGVQGSGSGTDKAECTGDCTNLANNSSDFNLGGAPVLGIGALFKIGKLFRIGPEIVHTFKMSISNNTNSATITSGPGKMSITNVDVVTELVPRVSRIIWLIPRIQLGLSSVSLSGAAGDNENAYKASCNANGLNGCDSLSSPHWGGHIGFGFGIMFATGDMLRLRADLYGDVVAAQMSSINGSNGNGQATVTESITVTRGLLLVGLEI